MRNPRRSTRRKRQQHGVLKSLLFAGAFASTWLGTNWIAEQDHLQELEEQALIAEQQRAQETIARSQSSKPSR